MNKSEIIKADLYAEQPKRINHIEGVHQCALRLAAENYPSLDTEYIACAAYMHDFTKEWEDEKQLALLENYGVVLDECEKHNSKLLHAKSAYVLAKYKYMLPQNVCDAVLYHTTGRADMTDIEKVIYLADYIELNRTHTDCKDVRDTYQMLTANGNPNAVEEAVLYSIDLTLEHLLGKRFVIHPNAVSARNYLITQLGV